MAALRSFRLLCSLQTTSVDCAISPLFRRTPQRAYIWRLLRGLTSFQVIYQEFGDPRERLTDRMERVEAPLKNNEVLIKMLMAPINPSDMNMVEGTYFIRPKLPAVVGNEGVGEVVEVGAGVKHLKAGDWVTPADSGFGTWRTYAVGAEQEFSKVEKDIPVLGAATLMVNPCTAYRMLKDYVQLRPGDVVIQNGANSAVGQAIIQLAREWDLVTVNIVRNRPQLDCLVNHLKSLGANHVITDEFCRSSGMKELMHSLSGKPKLALNCVGGKSATELLRNLADKGTMVTYGGMSRQPVTVPTGALIFKEVKLLGYWNTMWNRDNKDTPARQQMITELCDLLRKNKFQPPDCDIFSIVMYQLAVKAATEGLKPKKVVLKMDNCDSVREEEDGQ